MLMPEFKDIKFEKRINRIQIRKTHYILEYFWAANKKRKWRITGGPEDLMLEQEDMVFLKSDLPKINFSTRYEALTAFASFFKKDIEDLQPLKAERILWIPKDYPYLLFYKDKLSNLWEIHEVHLSSDKKINEVNRLIIKNLSGKNYKTLEDIYNASRKISDVTLEYYEEIKGTSKDSEDAFKHLVSTVNLMKEKGLI